MSLEGRNYIVTGAAQGIGRAVTNAIVGLGGLVTAIDINEAALQAGLGESDADRVLPIAGDITRPEFAAEAVDRSAQRFGAVHGLVNNAGIVRAAMINKMSLEAWQDVINVNLTGSFLFLQAFGRHVIDRTPKGETSPASIVNISSDAGRRGTVGQINYGASKSGLLGITMSAAREWARYGIRVNSVCFGVVETPMTENLRSDKFRDQYLAQIPLGRWSTPEEVAPSVCFLLSEASSYITGQHLSVSGGVHIGF